MRAGWTSGLAMLALALGACGSDRSDRSDPVETERDSAGNAMQITSVGSLPGTPWLYASFGVPSGGKFSSYSKPSRQRNALLIDRESGETIQLLPDNDGFVHEVWFVAAEAGALRETRSYVPDERGAPIDPPAYVLIETEIVTDETSERLLLTGSMEELALISIASGYDRIKHLEMLDETRLSVLLVKGGQYQLLVADLTNRKVLSSAKITPRPIN